ncbi:telomerase reverse transcriptase isoform X2 [Lasioglossum baleicum]|uniref:telomerase reverse transcriptase isoform X2 n=1 Tax=Lasioglossum baleicum TaxID=434251 RepID=UPI003FCE40FE
MCERSYTSCTVAPYHTISEIGICIGTLPIYILDVIDKDPAFPLGTLVMDNSTLQSIKEIFGTDFQQYCERYKIILKKDKYDTFMVPSISALSQCIDILEGSNLQIDNKLNQIHKPRLSSENQCATRLHKRRKITRKGEQPTYQNIRHNLFLTDLKLDIYLYDTFCVLPTCTIYTVPSNYILNTANTGNEIYEFILKKTMKGIDIVDYETSVPLISTLLNQFQKGHKNFHYDRVLRKIIQDQASTRNLGCKYEVPLKQVKSFFDLIFAKVVPLAIFGKLRNLKMVKKAMCQLLVTPRRKSFDLMFLFEKLDISCITWLNDIQIIKTRWLILAKFIKWFFNGYLLKILRSQFHVTTLSATNNKRIYIARPNWCLVQKNFIKKKILSNCLQPEIKCNEWKPPIGIYKLRAKNSSVRPIFLSKYPAQEKQHLQLILKFLRQLQITEYGLTNFQKTWKSVVQHKYNLGNEKFCLVSCDVKDAFGSIVQEVLVLSKYAVKCNKYITVKYGHTFCYKQYFDDTNLQLPLSPGSLYARTKHGNSISVMKSWLLEKIRKYIFYQRVHIRGKTYIIGKGIAQGLMLSPILSDIYYSYALQKQISSFLHRGEIFRYTDDILYATDNEILAKKFLELIKKGIPQFNCYFKEFKTQSNIINTSSTFTNNIKYIGYKINCDTLEVEPKDLNTHMRYLISFPVKNKITPLEFFRKRLYNVNGLLLSKVVLDRTINSEETIMRTLRKTCLMQAGRAYVLIKELFYNIEDNVQNIMAIIKITNKKVARQVMKIFLSLERRISKESVCTWYKRILHILWRSHQYIFRRDPDLSKYFMNYLNRKNRYSKRNRKTNILPVSYSITPDSQI